MAEPIRAKLDTSGFDAALALLSGENVEKLAASMAVAGGQVLRDMAKSLAPVESGALRAAIYLAFKEGKSNDRRTTYSVSWNAQKAPHGHLLEFGHWLVEGGKLGKGGQRVKFVPAVPFLGPALDIAGAEAQAAMIKRGRERLPELLRGQDGTRSEPESGA